MSSDLEIEIRIIQKQQGGRLSKELEPEFIRLCQEDFNYRPDTGCGKCIYKHAVKLYNKYLK
jgi:hypothetical protein